MKKFSAFIIVLSLLVFALCSCSGGGIVYEDITYREDGIEFIIPSSMRRSTDPEQPYTFSSPEVVFEAVKLNYDAMAENGIEISEDFDAKEYAEIVTASLDKSQIYYKEDAENNKYSFRYTMGETEETEVFYYVVVVGTAGNVWEITMSCYQSESDQHVGTFELWEKYIKTYNE